jgi:CBS domain-containing protein
MTTFLQPLLTRKAGDLMSRTVVLVPKEMSLPGAAHLLAQARVSGAPVVDVDGCCIGVLSTTDFLHYAERGKPAGHAKAHSGYSWEIVEDEEPQETVADYMNTDPVCVTPGTSIGEIARKMIDAHIHRVIVVEDEGNRPIGIVSSTDVMAAVAQADAQM